MSVLLGDGPTPSGAADGVAAGKLVKPEPFLLRFITSKLCYTSWRQVFGN